MRGGRLGAGATDGDAIFENIFPPPFLRLDVVPLVPVFSPRYSWNTHPAGPEGSEEGGNLISLQAPGAHLLGKGRPRGKGMDPLLDAVTRCGEGDGELVIILNSVVKADLTEKVMFK